MRKWVVVAVSAGLAAALTMLAVPHWMTVRSQTPGGPSLWDSASLVSGLALGTLLRVLWHRQAPTRGRILLTASTLLALGLVMFLPWPPDSMLRLLLPVIGLGVAAWGSLGERRASHDQV